MLLIRLAEMLESKLNLWKNKQFCCNWQFTSLHFIYYHNGMFRIKVNYNLHLDYIRGGYFIPPTKLSPSHAKPCLSYLLCWRWKLREFLLQPWQWEQKSYLVLLVEISILSYAVLIWIWLCYTPSSQHKNSHMVLELIIHKCHISSRVM